MTTPKSRKTENPIQLVGSWFNGDEYETDVEYIVARSGGDYTVRAIDRFDGEEGTVYDVHYDDTSTILSFNTLWKSTGRFLSVRLLAISPNRASCTYTYTDKEMWFRKGSEPTAVSKPARSRGHSRKGKVGHKPSA
jgi:hypothetical protein